MPYKDEETAEHVRDINAKDEKIAELEKEVEELREKVSELGTDETTSAVRDAVSSQGNTSGKDNGKDGGNNGEERTEDGRDRGQGQTFELTYYGMDCAGCSGVTASGLDISDGSTSYNGMKILAADTSVLPMNTVVRVTNPDGSSYKGIVKDVGGAIKGARIDVLVGSESEASNYGRHDAKVEVLP